jgi:hypothetical protein
MAEAMMPLLGYLTGRRIGLLTYRYDWRLNDHAH